MSGQYVYVIAGMLGLLAFILDYLVPGLTLRTTLTFVLVLYLFFREGK
jgi:hypothetical protein